jgi:hypothetical protein
MSERYIQNKEIIQSKIGDEVVMMDVESGFYFGLNSVGSVIWSHLSELITLDELLQKLVSQFEIDVDTCRKDTADFLDQLLEKKIIRKEP